MAEAKVELEHILFRFERHRFAADHEHHVEKFSEVAIGYEEDTRWIFDSANGCVDFVHLFRRSNIERSSSVCDGFATVLTDYHLRLVCDLSEFSGSPRWSSHLDTVDVELPPERVSDWHIVDRTFPARLRWSWLRNPCLLTVA